MLDGNISVEEDTELRDLVMQTLESNGVLAKVRAEIRASVFLALEEQETVMNPMPLLNKTVKQYLRSSEGKLLFSLVREFLEYFGLNYTISVYDPETYNGKEYNYVGRNKLCEELGINSTEPLLGEILKNTINGAFNNTQKNDMSNTREKTLESSTHFSNSTFEVTVPKVLDQQTVNDIDSHFDEQESPQDSDLSLPINVTITDKKQTEPTSTETSIEISDVQSPFLRKIKTNKSTTTDTDDKSCRNSITNVETDTNVSSELNKHESLIKLEESLIENAQKNKNEELAKPKIPRNRELHMTNNRNSLGKTMFFDEIIVGGKKEKVDSNAHKNEPLFDELPPLKSKNNSILCNLPPLNGKKEANINDVKEIMKRVADDMSNYDEDFSSPSGSTNEQSPSKEPDKSENTQKIAKSDDLSKTVQSEEISEEIDDLLTNTSCLDNVAVDKSISKITVGLASNYFKED